MYLQISEVRMLNKAFHEELRRQVALRSHLVTWEAPRWYGWGSDSDFSDVLHVAPTASSYVADYKAWLMWIVCGRIFISPIKVTALMTAKVEHLNDLQLQLVKEKVWEAYDELTKLIDKVLVRREDATGKGGVGATYIADGGLLPDPKPDHPRILWEGKEICGVVVPEGEGIGAGPWCGEALPCKVHEQ